MRRRLDADLVRRGLADDRSAARDLVESGRVTVAGAPALKVTRMVDPAESLVVTAPPRRFVGRGGEKLAGALESFGLDPAGLRVLDAGASTGGFTDCLLQAGAAAVVALDVGRNQLDDQLRRDARVVVLERTNLRHVELDELGRLDAAVADLSFISLTTVMDVLVSVVSPGGWLVVLVKPQFEATREEVDRGSGVISDPQVWHRALHRVISAARGRGAAMMGAMVSPLRGAEGNVEFLVDLRVPGPEPAGAEGADATVDAMVDAVVAEAAAGTASAGPTSAGGPR